MLYSMGLEIIKHDGVIELIVQIIKQCLERLKVGVEGDDRGRDGWMASPT